MKIEVLSGEGHQKYTPMTAEEAQELIGKIERGEVEGLNAGPYFVWNKNTKRVIGKLDIKDNQELLVVAAVGGG